MTVQPAAPGRWSVAKTARSAAPIETVWPFIGEARRWKEWAFLDRSEVIEEGEPTPDGVGALRRFSKFGIGSRERVVAWEPPRHLGYVIVKGFPVRNYRADVTCTPDGPGTVVSWVATFDPHGAGHRSADGARAQPDAGRVRHRCGPSCRPRCQTGRSGRIRMSGCGPRR